MRYGSVCSGIEAASVAWGPLGWEASFLAEIAPFASNILAHHYPETPNVGDFTAIRKAPGGPIDLLVGGTPCQSFSGLGHRGGIDDPRGQLALAYIRLVRRLRPRWVVWENVAACLHSGGGRDFGSFVGELADCGYGWAYRVLDAQDFGVPQSRRRVYLVGHLGNDEPAGRVLFQGPAMPATPRQCGPGGGSRPARVPGGAPGDDRSGQLRRGRQSPAGFNVLRVNPTQPGAGKVLAAEVASCLCASNRYQSGFGGTVILDGGRLRHLTALESERLQGFPDGYTDVAFRGKPASESMRCHVLGNSMAVPVVAWIGRGIAAVDAAAGVSGEAA